MRIVVDTNIVFSAILNTDSNIAQIIMQPKTRLNFYSTEKLRFEINEHRDKILKLTDYSDHELNRMISLLTNKIRFININLISKDIYNKAENLTSDIDIDDCEFIALTDHIKGKFWSGDKRLIKGLLTKKWDKFIGTEDIYKLILKR
ncbi:MAG: hypothetical protein GVY19_05060 [Bacteroidetes bacterium]|jgi:predicted nucleic acid-binding protein|nr:hypothetical protein [Bacteroidota bacterium]